MYTGIAAAHKRFFFMMRIMLDDENLSAAQNCGAYA